MNCGYFDHDSREYVITTPKTPTPWINYIGTRQFGGFIDQKGGGVICKGDPATNRIVKYIPQLPLSDFNGETLYARISDPSTKGAYTIISPFYTPVLEPYQAYECRVGLGYSLYTTRFHGLDFTILVFVPIGATQVIRRITVTNGTDSAVDVDLIPAVEYTHFDALKQYTNADWVPQTMQSDAIRQDNDMLILRQYAYMKKGRGENFLTSNYPVSSFESDRTAFLGDGGYGRWASPGALQQQELNNTEARRGDNIGALMHHLGTLEPGEAKTIITQLGQVDNVEDELQSIQLYRSETAVADAFTELNVFWNTYLDAYQADTPDDGFNAIVNVHNPHQCLITHNWSRYLSLYQLGLGARMMGFRDSSQDTMGVIAGAPVQARELLEMLLSVQKCNGSGMHQFNPVSMVANEGDSREEEDRPHYYGDDHLWVIMSTCEYIKETGDLAFLEKVLPFYDKDKHGKPKESGTVLNHLKRGIEFTMANRGSHGLPLLGFADWNDTVNLPEGAESVMIAGMFGVAAREMISLLHYLGDTVTTARFQRYYDEVRDVVNRVAWDGDWFIRYFDDKGQPLGSKENTYGKIYTNAQSWTVLAGFADADKARIALDSVYERLNTANGIKLSAPGYDHYIPEIGGVTTFPPGAKENGGIFLHSNPWVIIAETMLGRGDRAFAYHSQINPAKKNDRIEEYEIEPYCFAQNILSDEHPQSGLGRNSWLSGTASWMYQAATKFILGVRPTYGGLMIDPCIPAEWKGFRIRRLFRGVQYTIEIDNSAGVSKGVASIECDGKPVSGRVVPVSMVKGLDSCMVRVVMG
ncbi:MAG: GH36-type glycosyl hydrolase domain-containing protein [Spirochaeta sp.]